MRDRIWLVFVVLAASVVVGGVLGGLLSAYWWDFPPEDMERWRTETIAFYTAVGAFIGPIVAAPSIAVICMTLELRDRFVGRRRRRMSLRRDGG